MAWKFARSHVATLREPFAQRHAESAALGIGTDCGLARRLLSPPPPLPPPSSVQGRQLLSAVLPSRSYVLLCRSVRRFLPEVFPREEQLQQHAGRGNSQGASVAARRKRSWARSGTGLPPPLYGAGFRRLYGDAAYSLAAFLTRMCGGGVLKGLPLRELVETFFEGVACRGPAAVGGSSGSRSGSGGVGTAVAAAAGSAPHPELTALAVKHLPDLLQCFSEVCVCFMCSYVLLRSAGDWNWME